MAIDPLSILLLSTCIMACWPCCLPCCLALPIIPFPLILIESGKNMPKFKCANNSKCYYLYVTNSGFTVKRNQACQDSQDKSS